MRTLGRVLSSGASGSVIVKARNATPDAVLGFCSGGFKYRSFLEVVS